MVNTTTAIVFVHGLFRPPSFGGSSLEYFRNVERELADLPVSLYFPKLPSSESLKRRAEILTKAIESVTEDNIVLVAHSMGGLDSRYYVSTHPNDKRIKKIVTISTPHHGTLLADWVMQSRSPLAKIFRYQFGKAGQDLTTIACKAFNNNVPDRDDIDYLSYAAARPKNELPYWLRFFSKRVGGEANDGLVPVSSAQWGDFAGLLHADHFEATGWSLGFSSQANRRPFEHIDFYRRLIVKEIEKTTGN